tara:strand:- start:353 stop:796 length:444 start_codon:yes stop_codon:yes gene_type:complete
MSKKNQEEEMALAALYESSIAGLTRAEKRHKTLPILLVEKDFTDVVRQTGEIYNFCLSGLLHFSGIDSGGTADLKEMISLLDENSARMPKLVKENMRRLRDTTQRLVAKIERENVPDAISKEDAVRAMDWADKIVLLAQNVIKDYDD